MSKQASAYALGRAAVPVVESLECRQLLAGSAVLTGGGVLRITATEGADSVWLTENAKGSAVTVRLNGKSSSFATAKSCYGRS